VQTPFHWLVQVASARRLCKGVLHQPLALAPCADAFPLTHTRQHLWASGKASALFSECCGIDTQNVAGSIPGQRCRQRFFKLLTLSGFFWDSVFLGSPQSARTYGLGPAGSGNAHPRPTSSPHILAPNCGSGITNRFLRYAFSYV